MTIPAANRYHADFFETFRSVAEQFGEEIADGVMLLIASRHGNQQIRIPDLEDIWRETRDRRIQLEFNETNYEELGIKYHGKDGKALSVTQVRRIVVGKRR